MKTGCLQSFGLHSQYIELLGSQMYHATSHLGPSALADPSAWHVLPWVQLMNSYSSLNMQPKGHRLQEAFRYLSMGESLYPTRFSLVINLSHSTTLLTCLLFLVHSKLLEKMPIISYIFPSLYQGSSSLTIYHSKA